MAKSKPEDTKQKRGETEARAKWKVLSVRASRAPSRRVFAYRTREAYRHRLLCTGGMHTADIIFHRHRAATGIGNGSTWSTDGNPEPRERQRRSGGLRLVLSRKSKSSEIGRSRERLDSLRAPTDAARTDPPALQPAADAGPGLKSTLPNVVT